jgi:hypothetical protein
MEIAVVSILTGALLLLFGRQLFWLFVGIAGFLVGMEAAGYYFTGTEIARVLIALAIGLLGAVLAILFYKVAVAIAGFFVGAYLAVQMTAYLGVSLSQAMIWVPYIIGGIIGGVLVLLLFDWALIILSSVVGATLIVQATTIVPIDVALFFVILVVVGILVQGAVLVRSRSVVV